MRSARHGIRGIRWKVAGTTLNAAVRRRCPGRHIELPDQVVVAVVLASVTVAESVVTATAVVLIILSAIAGCILL